MIIAIATGMKKLISLSIIFFALLSMSAFSLTLTQPSVLNLFNATYIVNNYTINQSTQQNITGACGTGFVLQNVSNGVFQCVAQASGGGSGTVTSIVFRNGFNQTTITTSGTVDLNYTAVQQRVNESCASGSSIRVINLDGSVVCETDSSGSGTVTSVATGYGLYGGTITTSGTLYVNLTELTTNFGNWSADKPNYATINYVLGVNNLSYSQIASNIGNWSADKSSYATISYVNAVNNVSLSTIQGLINANGNYSQDANAIYNNITALQSSGAGYYTNITNLQTSNASAWVNLGGAYTNITALQTSNTTIFSLITALYNNITSLFTSNTTTNSRIDSVNTTKSGIGDCPSGQFVQNLTTGAPECFTPPTTGGGSSNSTDIFDFSKLSADVVFGATASNYPGRQAVTGSCTFAAYYADDFNGIEFRTGTALGNGCSYAFLAGGSTTAIYKLDNTTTWRIKWRIKTGASVADYRMFVGAVETQGVVPPANGIGVRYDTGLGDTNFTLVAWSASTPTTATQLFVEPVANTVYDINIWSTSDGTVYATVNNGVEATLTSGFTTSRVVPGSGLFTNTTAEKRMRLSRMSFEVEGLSP